MTDKFYAFRIRWLLNKAQEVRHMAEDVEDPASKASVLRVAENYAKEAQALRSRIEQG